jgi:hypothetical protein
MKWGRLTEEEVGRIARILGLIDWIVYLISLLKIKGERLSSSIDNHKLKQTGCEL